MNEDLMDNEGNDDHVSRCYKCQDAGSLLKNNIVHDPAFEGLSPQAFASPSPPQTSPMRRTDAVFVDKVVCITKAYLKELMEEW